MTEYKSTETVVPALKEVVCTMRCGTLFVDDNEKLKDYLIRVEGWTKEEAELTINGISIAEGDGTNALKKVKCLYKTKPESE